MTRLEDLPDILDVAMVAGFLGVDGRTIRGAISRGELRATRVGRLVRISKPHLLEYLGLAESQPEEPDLRVIEGGGP